MDGGVNTYAYVDNNPVLWGDPLGLRQLTRHEKQVLSPYIPQEDLDNADVHVGEVPIYTPRNMQGITRGNDIYFRDPNKTFCTPSDLADLGHELVHVGQYRWGMTWASYLYSSRHGYDPEGEYEKRPYEFGRRIAHEVSAEDCACK